MRTLEQLTDKLAEHYKPEFIYLDDDCNRGYIAWHVSTGGNVEVLYFEVGRALQGTGMKLYKLMAERLVAEHKCPYHSVFGFRLSENRAAEAFYDSLGWAQKDLGHSIYRDDATVIMWTSFSDLCGLLGVSC